MVPSAYRGMRTPPCRQAGVGRSRCRCGQSRHGGAYGVGHSLLKARTRHSGRMTNAGVGALQKGMGLGASIGLEGINEVDEFLAGQVLDCCGHGVY